MTLKRQQAKLTYSDPATDGATDLLGLSRVWTPGPRWTGTNIEVIEPLGCITQAGDLSPVSMAGAWTVNPSYSDKVRAVTMPGNPPTTCYEFFDASAYAAGTADTTCATYLSSSASMTPNVILRMQRYAAPDGQGVAAGTVVAVAASLRVTQDTGSLYFLDPAGMWTTGYVALSIPFRSGERAQASLFARALIGVGTYSDAIYLSSHEGGDAASAGGVLDCWAIEYLEEGDWGTDGHHILIRNLPNAEYWHVNHPCVKLVDGTVTLFMRGCRQQVNLSPITYSNGDASNVGYAWPVDPVPLPSAAWNPDSTWGLVANEPANWTASVSDADSATFQAAIGYRPTVELNPATGDLTTRPVVWLVTEDHPRTTKSPSVSASQDTEGDATLVGLELTVADYGRSWQGSATFKPSATELYPAWLPGGKIVVNAGWQADAGAGLAADDIATCYILPDGIKRGIDAGGWHTLTVEFGDWFTAHPDAAIVDFAQAGGFAVETWADAAALAMGLPDSLVTVDAGIAADVLPVGKPPSRPSLQPQDGDKWREHVDAVCGAAEIHWTWAADGWHVKDKVRPAYSHGVSTIAFTLDEDTTTDTDIVTKVDLHQNAGQHATALKVVYGQAGREATYYSLAAADEREADGVERWAVLELREGDDTAAALARWGRDNRVSSEIEWAGQLRPDLMPGEFVQVSDLSLTGVTVNSVYQITEHRMSIPAEGWPSSTITMVWVYTPTS